MNQFVRTALLTALASSAMNLVLDRELLSQETVVAFRNARIRTAAQQDFDPGTLVISAGKIQAVGPVKDVPIPAGARVIDVTGRVIIPGLVDTHSHLGVNSRPQVRGNSDGNEMTGPVQSGIRALDALNAFDPGIRMAVAGGVTAANVMPGSGNVIGGQTIYVKLRGPSPEQMQIRSPRVLGGLKMANGENPKRSYGGRGKSPGTRMKIAALQRTEFLKAQEYAQKWNRYRRDRAAGKESAVPDVDLNLQSLVEVLERKRTVHFHTHRADDILTVLRLRKEFNFELLIQHGTEAYKVIDEIARHQVPVSMTVVDSPGGKAEVVDFIEQCGADLARAGVKVLVNTDDPVTESRFFLRTASIPVRGGLNRDLALRAITIHPAQVMHLEDRIGSLEQGKDADFVVLSGEPFSVYTRVLATYIDGRRMFSLDDPRQRLYQTGGFAVAQDSLIPEPAALVKKPQRVTQPAAPRQAPQVTPASTDYVVLAGRVHTVSKGTLANAAIVVRNGLVHWVGPADQLEQPANMPVLTAHEVTPGLIDAHSVVPLSGEYNIPADQDADELSSPNQADVRVIDGFNPSEPLLRFLLEQGVTVVHACPGRANVIGGSTGVFRTHGRQAESMVLRFPHAMLFNLGNAPKDTYREQRQQPSTRMGTAALIRSALTEAGNVLQKRRRAAAQGANGGSQPPPRDLKHEALGQVLSGKLRVMFCAHRADDLHTALRLMREFKLKGNLALATEGYLIRDSLREAGLPIVVHPSMQRVGGPETYNSFLGNAAALKDAGIRIAIGSAVEGYVPKTRVIRHEAAIAMVHGLGFQAALKAITLDAARILEIDKTHGSIEVGKQADLVLYDGDPFEHATHVTHVVVGGKLVHNRQTRAPVPMARRLFYHTPNRPCCIGW